MAASTDGGRRRRARPLAFAHQPRCRLPAPQVLPGTEAGVTAGAAEEAPAGEADVEDAAPPAGEGAGVDAGTTRAAGSDGPHPEESEAAAPQVRVPVKGTFGAGGPGRATVHWWVGITPLGAG